MALGKTTLINQRSGKLTPTAGTLHRDSLDVTRAPIHRRVRLGIARGDQITSVFPDFPLYKTRFWPRKANADLLLWRSAAGNPVLVEQSRSPLARVASRS